VRVRRHVLADLVHGLPDADARGEMYDRIHALERLPHERRIAYVSDEQFDVSEVLGPLGAPVNLLHERVQDAHLVAALQERVGQVRADESSASRDQDPLQATPPPPLPV
jgi:hypothetical protein